MALGRLRQVTARLTGKRKSADGADQIRAFWTVSPHPELLEVDKWAASSMVLALQRVVGDRPYPLDELLLMTAAFAFHRPEIVIDIGTHLGKSARIWHELNVRLGTETTIHTIDLLDPNHPEYPGTRHAEYVRNTPVQRHVGDGAVVAADLIRGAPERRYLLFLDGDHRYETVLQELELVRLLPGDSGLLLHDTLYQPSSAYNHGPYLALQEFTRTFPARQVLHMHAGLPGMSYIGLQPR
jgi:methyltransferase family protein